MGLAELLSRDDLPEDVRELLREEVARSETREAALAASEQRVRALSDASFEAIFLRILLMILPDLVFGNAFVNCILSGLAIGPISFLTV